jgi:hypothetical protein
MASPPLPPAATNTLLSALAAVAARYNAVAQARPLATNATMGFGLASGGDVACQVLLEKRPLSEVAWRRTLDMGVIRAGVMAPFLQLYFPFLSRLVPGTTMPQVLKRVVADQLIGAPVSICLIFFAAACLRGDPASVVPRLEQQMVPTWQSGATYWPFVHSLNFRFVPVAHHAVVAHVASIWWNVVLSYRANIKLKGAGDGGEGGEGGTGEAGAPPAATAGAGARPGSSSALA